MKYVQLAKKRKPVDAASLSVSLQILAPSAMFAMDMPRSIAVDAGVLVIAKSVVVICSGKSSPPTPQPRHW